MSERAIRRREILTEQLQTALNSRVIIEQAKGVLAQRGGLGMHAAFDRLRRYARDRNETLSEVARRGGRVVETDLATDILAAPAGHRVSTPPAVTRLPPLLSVVVLADDAFIGGADDWGVRKPRPVVVGGALVGSVTGCSAW